MTKEIKNVTIITVCYNSEKTIRETIESVLNQTHIDFEYILIDGDSTDKTVTIIKSFEKKFKEKNIRFKWISEKDSGIYDAFNKGIKLANSNWISFLGSDDLYLENAIEIYSEEINKLAKKVDFIHSNVEVEGVRTMQGKWLWKTFKRNMSIAHVGSFHNLNYFKKYSDFDTSYKIAGDYELLLRAKENLKTHWINKKTVLMSAGGISNNQIKKVYAETTRAKKQTGQVNFFLYNFDYIKWMFKYYIKITLNAFTR